jgi:poly(3-hydroxybutyrate) depolymerase
MRRGPDNDVLRVADDAQNAARRRGNAKVALLVIHGDRDDVVSPVNASALVEQFLRFDDPQANATRAPDRSTRTSESGKYEARVDDWLRNGELLVRYVHVEGLAHAWSGGDGAFDFADPRGPDALALLARFVADSARWKAAA